MRRSFPLVLLLAAVLGAPAASGQPDVGAPCGAEKQSLRDRGLAFAAYAKGPVRALSSPEGDVMRTFARRNANGVRTVFGVLAATRDASCRPTWYQVQLPMRPNGAVGWVKADRVVLDPVRTRIEVDLSKRRLWLFRDGRLVVKVPAGEGAEGTPTPTGSFYVNQRFYIHESWGPFGPGAIGISAFSPTLKDWAQGGPIAIHGTNQPSSVGQAASHGCIRVHNRVLRRLLWATETGSPVVIHA